MNSLGIPFISKSLIVTNLEFIKTLIISLVVSSFVCSPQMLLLTINDFRHVGQAALHNFRSSGNRTGAPDGSFMKTRSSIPGKWANLFSQLLHLLITPESPKKDSHVSQISFLSISFRNPPQVPHNNFSLAEDFSLSIQIPSIAGIIHDNHCRQGI